MTKHFEYELHGPIDSDAPITVITGSTRGIGRHVASAMARAGHLLVLPGRSAATSDRVCRDLHEETGNNRIYWATCDLLSMVSIRECALKICESVPRIDILINNAGYFGKGFARSDDGFEAHLATNYLAPFALTHQLLPALRAAPAARVVNVAGETARIGRIRLDDLNRERRFSVLGAYAQSKLAMMMFTRILAARTADTSIVVNALQPGRAATGHLSAGPRWLDKLWRVLSPRPQRAASAVTALALRPTARSRSGRYYMRRLRMFAPISVYRSALVRSLYATTVQLVGLQPSLRLTPINGGL